MIALPWFHRLSERLDWIQVEVTTRCNAACVYCPQTAYGSQWENRDFPLVEFKRLLPTLEQANLVYLQGWGEPFLNPDFFGMIREAKARNLKVGSTTNGMLLDRETLVRLVEEGLDDLAFSLAGVEPETNDRIRKGTSLAKVLRVMDDLAEIKAQRGVQTPVVRVAYMLLRSNANEVQRLPALLARHGVGDAVISPLTFVCDPTMQSEALTPDQPAGESPGRKKLFRLSMAAAFQGVNMFYHWLAPRPRRRCTEHVAKSLVVGAGGEVSPCMLTQLPVRGRVNYWFLGRKREFEPFILGSISEAEPMEMRRRPEFERFLKDLRSGKPVGNCAACWKLHALTE